MLNQALFKQIDNSALIIFRVFFGGLIFLESIGAIITGWVNRVLIEPEFTFTLIGIEWLQPLPGNWMYVYYAIMGVFGLFVMLGYKYRLSIIAFTIMWTLTYLMQKSSYNNHYYLLILLSGMMMFLPANAYFSIDASKHPEIVKHKMPRWCSLVFILQMAIVYTYASVAKLYPDWLDASVIEILLSSKKDYFLIGNFLQQPWVHYIVAYFGIIFDLLIVPLLLWKTTRKYAFIFAVFFHLFNSIVFQIGIFPYMSIAICVFFFDPEIIRNIFFKKKQKVDVITFSSPKKRSLFLSIFIIYFTIQVGLPLRHWVIKDDVLWTEEGHRLSWRMMLRAKSGLLNFNIIDKVTRKRLFVNVEDYLTAKQRASMSTKPDMIWQFSKYLHKKFKERGQDVEVFVESKVRVNGRPFRQLIDPTVDLSSVKWEVFKHSDWILPSTSFSELKK